MDKYWVIIDVETDGLEEPIHVIDISAQRMHGWEKCGYTFSRLINHDIDIPSKVSAIHGFTKEILSRDGENPLSVYNELRKYVKDSPVVAYNLKFDWDKVLLPEWNRIGIRQIGTRGFCALELTRRILNVAPGGNFKLQTLCKYYKLPDYRAHSATGDVLSLVDLFSQVLKPKAKEKGLLCWNDLVEFSKTEWYPEIIQFGKYKGRNYKDAITDSKFLSWIEWLTESEKLRFQKMGNWYLDRLKGQIENIQNNDNNNQFINFKYFELEDTIRNYLGISGNSEPIHCHHIESLLQPWFVKGFKGSLPALKNIKSQQYLLSRTELILSGQGITDLSSLVFFRNVKKLILNNNRIKDLNPIAHLKYLEELEISENLISDITPLSKLKYLRILDISKNKVKDITPLEELQFLTLLDISNNSFRELSLNEVFQNIRELHINNNSINSVKISKIKNLDLLQINGSKINDLHIEGLSYGFLFDMDRYPKRVRIENVTGSGLYLCSREDMQMIETITIIGCKDFELDIHYCKVGVLEIENSECHFGGFVKFNKCQVRSIGLANVVCDEHMDFDSCGLVELSLSNVLKTNVIEVSHCELKLVEMTEIPSLRHVSFYDCKLESISFLHKINCMESICLDNNLIVDLSPIRKMDNLERIQIEKNKIRCIKPILELEKLKEVHLAGNCVEESEFELLEKHFPDCLVYDY